MSTSRLAQLLAIDITTTEFALAVRDAEGAEEFVRLKMRGATCWKNDPRFPGFDLTEIPCMLAELLDQLEKKGWQFRRPASSPGCVSVSCRQHDQVVLDAADQPLLPALMWQCNAATDEVEWLRERQVEQSVGPLAPRFVLPKLLCVLRQEPDLRSRIGKVMLTGDWVAYGLTGKASLAKSDALSNGLLDQASRQLATTALEAADFPARWFPPLAESGTEVGTVLPSRGGDDPWEPSKQRLAGWRFAAGLGDNHASAVGCGMTDDYRRVVVSAGTSGTINWSCAKDYSLSPHPETCRFEFYEQNSLILKMLGDCGAWYSRFYHEYAPEYADQLSALNRLLHDVELSDVRRVLHNDDRHCETPPPGWARMSLGAKTACTQFSIVLELLLRVSRLIHEAQAGRPYAVDTYVLTGGLSQSRFFQQCFAAGVGLLAPQAQVKVSGREGPLRFKTSAYGALVNAELLQTGSLQAIVSDTRRFPLLDCATFDPLRLATAQYLLAAAGLG